MAETTRPRPRPRPRPVPKAAALQSGSSSTATTSKVTEIEDDDSMFMRNQTRTTNTWTKLDKIAPGQLYASLWSSRLSEECTLVKKAKVQTGSDSDEVEIVSPRRRQKKKAGSEAPRWQEEKNFTRYVHATIWCWPSELACILPSPTMNVSLINVGTQCLFTRTFLR